jgi:hypothetical protein
MLFIVAQINSGRKNAKKLKKLKIEKLCGVLDLRCHNSGKECATAAHYQNETIAEESIPCLLAFLMAVRA